eukprot:TRINITY_DN192364_c0_g1_i1.p1 TRINITY_DN192364_c0_g1~~TRINITY_DN192364_c0_g1_i1.p1  ORF type:complete len:231 (+),score=17.41 TRINITY_DN192364_c0_g1_i1:107-799(+)
MGEQTEDAPNAATCCVIVTGLRRPFTEKQLLAYLSSEGTVTRHWLDKLKTKCLVQYSSEEECAAAKSAFSGVVWAVGVVDSTLRVEFIAVSRLDDALAHNHDDDTEATELPLTVNAVIKAQLSKRRASPHMKSDNFYGSNDMMMDPLRLSQTDHLLAKFLRTAASPYCLFYKRAPRAEVLRRQSKRRRPFILADELFYDAFPELAPHRPGTSELASTTDEVAASKTETMA